MAETYTKRVHTENAVLDIGEDIGALVIYTGQEMLGNEIEVCPKGNHTQKIHTAVLERKINRRTLFAALFLELPEGDYITLTTPSARLRSLVVRSPNWTGRHLTSSFIPRLLLTATHTATVLVPLNV